MGTSAPRARIVNALNGDIAPSPVLGILATADHIHDALAEVDGLRELQTRVQELEAENAELDRRRGCWEGLATATSQSRDEYAGMVDQLIVERNALAAERDNLASDLVDLRQAHEHTLGLLARARAERDTANLRAVTG